MKGWLIDSIMAKGSVSLLTLCLFPLAGVHVVGILVRAVVSYVDVALTYIL